MYKQIIVEALERNGHDIEQVDTPLGNEMILDGKWLLEMDRDGAFAVTISPTEKTVGSYSDTHRLVVFYNTLDNSSDRNEPFINSQIVSEMYELEQAEI